MALQFFNTLTRKKEEFKPLHAGKVSIYSCGPTVYNLPHIGNWRSFLFADLLRRYLAWKGLKVTQVMNLTDVDDKSIANSKKEGIPLAEFTKRYADAFFKDANALNILPADRYPRATEHIKEMQALIQKLLDHGFAYKSDDGSVYFSIIKFKEYGRLAHLNREALKPGGRVLKDEYEKGHAHDFALWKAAGDGDVAWDAPFGKGRPGWHIECSAMSQKYLGDSFDIHTGGVDLIFPHHENEIAQSEAATGKRFVRYWLHSEHLLVDGKKMAKSLGNFYTLEDVMAKGYGAKAVRYFLLATHYRQQLNFTFSGLDAAKNTVAKLEDFMRRLKEQAGPGKASAKVIGLIAKAKEGFSACMDDDLGVSEALAAVFAFISQVNSLELSPGDAKAALEFMHSLDQVLGVLSVEESEELPKEIEHLIKERELARKKGDFKTSDLLRAKLLEKGIRVDDTKQGTRWKRVS
ncbi:MAG: cysteine--tRNA ligase [Nanoarchaeota archaeon]